MTLGFICDFLDGYVARKLNLVSEFGNNLDKIVDKINHICIFITISNKFDVSYIYILCYFLREIIMFFLRYYNFKSMNSSFHGKIKTFIFPISIIFFDQNFFFKDFYITLWTIYNFLTLLK
jgi:CDP-diacylglycerol--glycerol-3-phosphate 3-phosphatidyltransferase